MMVYRYSYTYIYTWRYNTPSLEDMDTHGYEYDLGSRIAEVGIIWGSTIFSKVIDMVISSIFLEVN